MRAPTGSGIRVLCGWRRAHPFGRAAQKARGAGSQPVLRPRVLDCIRAPGRERHIHRQLLLSYRYEANLVGGAIVTLLGLFMMGLAKIPWLQREFRMHVDLGGGRPLAAYVIGIAFAFGWTPCIGPVLGAILTTSAVAATVFQGVVLLSFYSLGLGLPFLAAAVFTDSLMLRIGIFRRLGRSLQLAAGAVVTAMGVAMVTGELTSFSYWLLDTFPILARLG